MTKGMTYAATSVQKFRRRQLRLGFELRTPIAERLERNPVTLAIFTLIELAFYPGLMVRPPKSLAVTFANWRHLVLHLKIYRREQIASEPQTDKCARNGRLPDNKCARNGRLPFLRKIPCSGIFDPC